uniref:Uncharacterized protein n=1 Tax=Arundo donax TaxID=35708 RepID=A0A0A9A1A5_ARUDO
MRTELREAAAHLLDGAAARERKAVAQEGKGAAVAARDGKGTAATTTALQRRRQAPGLDLAPAALLRRPAGGQDLARVLLAACLPPPAPLSSWVASPFPSSPLTPAARCLLLELRVQLWILHHGKLRIRAASNQSAASDSCRV